MGAAVGVRGGASASAPPRCCPDPLPDGTGDGARCCCFLRDDAVGERVRNLTLRRSGLSASIGRYCDWGLNPDDAFRLVFSRTVSMSCTSFRRFRSSRLITRPQYFQTSTSITARVTPPAAPPAIAPIGTDEPPLEEGCNVAVDEPLVTVRVTTSTRGARVGVNGGGGVGRIMGGGGGGGGTEEK